MTSIITYQGQLRTSSIHLQSGTILISDAPTDNHGKGEAFSPTDTVANALGSCMFTVMGIKAEQHGVNLAGSEARITKHMADAPRRIAAITVEFRMKGVADHKMKEILERTALHCPVLLSLHPDIKKEVTFDWQS